MPVFEVRESRSRNYFLDFDLQPRFTQSDLVAGLQPYAAEAWRHDNRHATSLNACSVGASVVIQTIFRRTAGGFDMSMSSRHAGIRFFGAFGESHMVRPHQTVLAIPNVQAPAKVDA